jgi:hypothetical protein
MERENQEILAFRWLAGWLAGWLYSYRNITYITAPWCVDFFSFYGTRAAG